VPSVAAVGLLVLIAHAFVIVVNLAQFRSGGGNPHERYLMTIMPLVAIVLSVGLLAIVHALPWGEVRRREEVAAVLISAFLVGMAAATFAVWVRTQIRVGADLMLPEIRPVPYVVLGVGAICAVAAVALPMLWRPRAEMAEPVDVRVLEPRRSESTRETVGGPA
ncbi:MAG TPA: hypothetical protein VIP58_05445, partial [Nocardioides sp.]